MEYGETAARTKANTRPIVNGVRLVISNMPMLSPASTRILQNGASILRRKMMERRKHRSLGPSSTRNVHRVDRVRIEGDVMLGSRVDLLECPEIWIFVREPNLKRRRAPPSFASQLRARSNQGPPPPEHKSTTDSAGIRPAKRRVQCALQQRNDGRVEIQEVEPKLKRIRDFISKR